MTGLALLLSPSTSRRLALSAASAEGLVARLGFECRRAGGPRYRNASAPSLPGPNPQHVCQAAASGAGRPAAAGSVYNTYEYLPRPAACIQAKQHELRLRSDLSSATARSRRLRQGSRHVHKIRRRRVLYDCHPDDAGQYSNTLRNTQPRRRQNPCPKPYPNNTQYAAPPLYLYSNPSRNTSTSLGFFLKRAVALAPVSM